MSASGILNFCSKNFMVENNLNSLILKSVLKLRLPKYRIVVNIKAVNFSTDGQFLNSNEKAEPKKNEIFIQKNGSEVKKIKPKTPKINLINKVKGTKTSMYMEHAEKLAKRNNWKIEQIGEKNNKPIFELSTAFNNNVKKNDEKGWKKIIFNFKISEHDLDIKVNNIQKFLQKGKSVRAVIEGRENQSEKLEDVFKIIQAKLKNFPTIKDVKKSKLAISFIITPPSPDIIENIEKSGEPLKNDIKSPHNR